jgi:hypothetical protein
MQISWKRLILVNPMRAGIYRPGPTAASAVATGLTAYRHRCFVRAYIGLCDRSAV